MKVGIVGPCAAGKTSLQDNLLRLGYDARAIGQEHSLVQTMWQQIAGPDILVYLDATRATICARLGVQWEEEYIGEQKRRLTHARAHADLFVDTNDLTLAQVRDRVVAYLAARR